MTDAPRVAVICGSRSDLPALKGCFDVLDSYGITWRASVISAHRQADALHAHVAEAEGGGVELFIGAAGLAAHLPGVLASLTGKPVIGIPLDGGRVLRALVWKVGGDEAISHLWDGPGALPSDEEMDDPGTWVRRVVPGATRGPALLPPVSAAKPH